MKHYPLWTVNANAGAVKWEIVCLSYSASPLSLSPNAFWFSSVSSFSCHAITNRLSALPFLPPLFGTGAPHNCAARRFTTCVYQLDDVYYFPITLSERDGYLSSLPLSTQTQACLYLEAAQHWRQKVPEGPDSLVIYSAPLPSLFIYLHCLSAELLWMASEKCYGVCQCLVVSESRLPPVRVF